MFDHLLFLGYGAPETPQDLIPYFEERTKEKPVSPERLEEVLGHYRAIGGFSPYNREVRAFLEKLMSRVHTRGILLPHFLAMRYGHPSLDDVLREIQKRKLKKGLVIILTAVRSAFSFDGYVEKLEAAKKRLGLDSLDHEYCNLEHDHPLLIQAYAEETMRVLGEFSDRPVLFSAHSIPLASPDRPLYQDQIARMSVLVAAKLGLKDSCVVYQSRSGSPQAWLGPDLKTVFLSLKKSGKKAVAVIPIGFLFENTEILYDLDIEFRGMVEQAGIRYDRARTVAGNPHWIQGVEDFILEKLQKE